MEIEETLTGARGKGGGGWWKEGEGLIKDHVCMTHEHGQQCGD